MKTFLGWMMTVIRSWVIVMFGWGLLLAALFIIIGLFIGIAQVILGGTADILFKYTAVILIAVFLWATFDYITSSDDDDPAPHECV